MKKSYCATIACVVVFLLSFGRPAYLSAADTVTFADTGLTWEYADNQKTINWNDACTYCDTLELGGYSDWRLPRIDELRSIVDYSKYSMAQDEQLGQIATNRMQTFWSATGYPFDPDSTGCSNSQNYAWSIDFYSGSIFPRYKVFSQNVRCVRGTFSKGELDPSGRLEDQGNGTVRDTVSNHIWQNSGIASNKTYAEAESYCDSLTLGGITDWRLPNIRELQNIIDYTRNEPAVGSVFLESTINRIYWSKTTFAGDDKKNLFWGVDFLNGAVTGDNDVSVPEARHCVRCVSGAEEVIPPPPPPTDCSGNPCSLTVKVSDATTGDGISGMLVTIQGEGISDVTATTNSSGDAVFSNNILLDEVRIIMDGTLAGVPQYVQVNQTVAFDSCGSSKTVSISLLPLDEGTARGDIRFILTWGADPNDLDSHLSGPTVSGGSFEIYYGNRNCTMATGSSVCTSPTDPDIHAWLDVDDVTGYGPETTTIPKLDGKYVAGSYKFWVHHFAGSSSIPAERDNILVQVYQGDVNIAAIHPPDPNVVSYDPIDWTVANVEISEDGEVTFETGTTGLVQHITLTPYRKTFGTVDSPISLETHEPLYFYVTITNVGISDLKVTDMILTDTTNFSINSNSCGSMTPILGSGATCSVKVDFDPQYAGTYNTLLRIQSNDSKVPIADVEISAVVTSNLQVTPSDYSMRAGSVSEPRYGNLSIVGGTPPFQAVSGNPGFLSATVSDRTVNLTSMGNGRFNLYVIDSRGNQSTSQVSMITSDALWADFYATPIQGFGAPISVQFTDQSYSPTGVTSWTWTFGDGGTSTEASPSHTYENSGIYSVSLKVDDASTSETMTRTNFIQVFPSGDLNCDGNLTIRDAIMAMAVQLSDTAIPAGLCFDDVDGDGNIGLGEVLYILQGIAEMR